MEAIFTNKFVPINRNIPKFETKQNKTKDVGKIAEILLGDEIQLN